MCSVGDAFNIDISEEVDLHKYKCNDCEKEFKGMALIKNIKCPSCHSSNTVKI